MDQQPVRPTWRTRADALLALLGSPEIRVEFELDTWTTTRTFTALSYLRPHSPEAAVSYTDDAFIENLALAIPLSGEAARLHHPGHGCIQCGDPTSATAAATCWG